MAIRSVILNDNIGELVTEFNLMGTDIGDLSLLTTSVTSSLVGAIQSLDSDLRVDLANAIDSDLVIQLITNEDNLVSIFDSNDFQIVGGRVSIRDSSSSFEIVNDTTTNSSFYLTLSNQTSGFQNILNITDSKLSFNPSTGVLDVSKVDADSATSINLNSTNATLTNINVDSATITVLTSVSTYTNSLNGDSATLTNIAFTSMNGGNIEADSATFTGIINAQDFNSTSDIGLKENIETLNNAINVLNNIRPVSFVWKQNGKPAYGVIAQEVEEVLPEIVDQDKHGVKRVAYSQIIPFLVQVIQEQNKEIQNIKAVLNLE